MQPCTELSNLRLKSLALVSLVAAPGSKQLDRKGRGRAKKLSDLSVQSTRHQRMNVGQCGSMWVNVGQCISCLFKSSSQNFKGNWFQLKVIAVRQSVGLNSEGCLDANPKQTGWSLTSRRLYTCFMPLTSFDNYDKSTSLSIAFTCRKKSACESCKMQWFKSWLDCNGLQHVTPLTDGGSSLASFGSCWPSPSWILCNALERQESKMQGGRKKVRKVGWCSSPAWQINTDQTYQRISQLVLGESALIPHKTCKRSANLSNLYPSYKHSLLMWSHPRIPFHSEPTRSTSASLNSKGCSTKCVGSSVASDLLARLQIRRLKDMSHFHCTEEWWQPKQKCRPCVRWTSKTSKEQQRQTNQTKFKNIKNVKQDVCSDCRRTVVPKHWIRDSTRARTSEEDSLHAKTHCHPNLTRPSSQWPSWACEALWALQCRFLLEKKFDKSFAKTKIVLGLFRLFRSEVLGALKILASLEQHRDFLRRLNPRDNFLAPVAPVVPEVWWYLSIEPDLAHLGDQILADESLPESVDKTSQNDTKPCQGWVTHK